MSDNLSDMERRIEELTSELVSLKNRLDSQLHTGQSPEDQLETPPSPAVVSQPVKPQRSETKSGDDIEISDELLSWAGRASLLPRLATLCFLLVVALTLRTLTESSLINTLSGSALGMAYAAVIMMIGWYRYRQESPLAPVFTGCGAVLMATIVVETHMHFQSLPLVPAYFTLMVTGIAMAVVSYQFNAFTPISLGTLSMCLAGAAIDYPHPYFPYMAMILITANILGYFAARLKRCAWLRWIILIVTLAMMHLWALRLGTALYRKVQPAVELAPHLYFLTLAVFAVTYLSIALYGILRSGAERISRFDFSLPTVNVLWTFAAACYVIGAGGGSRVMLSAIAVTAALMHLAIGYWLATRQIARAPGTNSFVFAGSVLLALSLPYAMGSAVAPLPVLSALAVGLMFLSHSWQSGGIRMTSYLTQIFCSTSLAIALINDLPPKAPLLSLGAALSASLLALYHYLTGKKIAPPASSEIFNRFDKRDRMAVLLLFCSLSNAFFFVRVIAYRFVSELPGTVAQTFSCTQSAVINIAATAIMLIAFRKSSKELRNVAICITVIGGVKVFLFDLLHAHGVALVISVLSFGIAAAVESVALSKWQETDGSYGRPGES